MSSALWLDDSELKKLTKKIRPSAQVKVLNSMCIDHRKRPDGSIVVLRSAFEQANARQELSGIPNMEAI